MNGKNINFNDKKIRKSEFYRNKKISNINDIDVNKILVSKKEPYGTKNSFKYFIGYSDNDVIRPLCIRLPKMTGKFDKYIKAKIKIYANSINTNFHNKKMPKRKSTM